MFAEIAESVQDQTFILSGQTITIRRLDQIHPQISGNKFFKLKYNFEQAQQNGCHKILSFGGAYSNHIAAIAYAAHRFGFESVGIIRGDELKDRTLNPTLALAQHLGMQLHFVSRADYRQKTDPLFLAQLQQQYPEHYVIPEGGSNALAIQGCQEILSAEDEQFDVICCPVGTGGTIAGLIQASRPHQYILGFSALKGDFLKHDVAQLTQKTNWHITDAYCFGGYAKIDAHLLQFITDFEQRFSIPLEQVYTAKMLYGLNDLIQQQYFAPQQNILVIHTGGLQGKMKSKLSNRTVLI